MRPRAVVVLLMLLPVALPTPSSATGTGTDFYAAASSGSSAGGTDANVRGAPDGVYATLGDKPGNDLLLGSAFETSGPIPRVLLAARYHVSAPFSADRIELTYLVQGQLGARRALIVPASVSDTTLLLDVTDDRAWTHDELRALSVRLKYLKADGTQGEGKTVRVDALWVRLEGAHMLSADFSWAPARPLRGEPVAFDARTVNTSPVTSWSWTFGASANASGPTVAHAFTAKGNHSVTLTVRDATGATASSTRIVEVPNRPPVAGFTHEAMDPNSLARVDFRDASSDPDGGVARLRWEFGDGTVLECATGCEAPTHAYPSQGPYVARLRVWDAEGASATFERLVETPNRPPVARFTHDPSDPTDLDDIRFVDASTDADGVILAWEWDFGDGAVSTHRLPVHRYADDGVYLVRLVVRDEHGGISTQERPVEVRNVPPTASFSTVTLSPWPDWTLQFTSHAADPEGRELAYAWDFGDGATSALPHPAHRFASKGPYTVVLNVTDEDGATASASATFELPNDAPVAAFALPERPMKGRAAQFADRSADPDGTLVSWCWDFGDGSTSTLQHPAHAYAAVGTYLVRLEVRDARGASASTEASLVVANVAPTAAPSLASSPVTTVSPAVFRDGSTDPDGHIVSWRWRFGDGNVSTDREPSHRYERRGTYAVELRVVDDDGAEGTTSFGLEVVNSPPVAAFAPPGPATDLDIVAFRDASTDADGRIVSWSWTFGDGATASTRDASHRFADDGAYRVALTVTDDEGASSTVERVVLISNVAPTPSFLHQAPSAAATRVLAFTSTSTDPDGIIVGHLWSFGDGDQSDEASPVHTYAAGGLYTIALTVTDNDGATATLTRLVRVCPNVCLQVVTSRSDYQSFETVRGTVRANVGGLPFTLTVRPHPTSPPVESGRALAAGSPLDPLVVGHRIEGVLGPDGTATFEVPRFLLHLPTGVTDQDPLRETKAYDVRVVTDGPWGTAQAGTFYRVHLAKMPATR